MYVIVRRFVSRSDGAYVGRWKGLVGYYDRGQMGFWWSSTCLPSHPCTYMHPISYAEIELVVTYVSRSDGVGGRGWMIEGGCDVSS